MTENRIECRADGENRLDTLLSDASGLTRSRIAQLIKDGQVLLEGKPAAKPGLKPKVGETIVLTVPPVKEGPAQAQDIQTAKQKFQQMRNTI